ncbi:hypothetical protein K1T71_005278, partial [Dendrolimus kikuchii]
RKQLVGPQSNLSAAVCTSANLFWHRPCFIPKQKVSRSGTLSTGQLRRVIFHQL